MSRRAAAAARGRIGAALAALAALAAAPAPATADAYEAALQVAPEAGVAWLGERDAPGTAAVPAAGLAAGLGYGLSNRLALDVQLAAGSFGRAEHAGAVVRIGGSAQPPGTLARTTRFARVVAGATVRFGVAVIPTAGVGLGLGARLRGPAAFSNAAVMAITPDDDADGVTLDLLATARVGLDVRFGVHWLAGVTVAATHAVPLGGPDADLVTAQLHLAYYWYPLW